MFEKTNEQIEYCLKRLDEIPIKNDGDLIFQMQCTRSIMMMLGKWEPNEQLSLEQLKQMIGKPVYISNEWVIIRSFSANRMYAVGSEGEWYDTDDYGKTWVTYAHEKENEND